MVGIYFSRVENSPNGEEKENKERVWNREKVVSLTSPGCWFSTIDLTVRGSMCGENLHRQHKEAMGDFQKVEKIDRPSAEICIENICLVSAFTVDSVRMERWKS